MSSAKERPCGLYRTSEAVVGRLEAGQLVFYHNHGDPGPGLYPVERWRHNKAVFSKRGFTLPREGYEQTLEPLAPEGFYRVRSQFHCCDKRCRTYLANDLVQLGYNGRGEAILFVPRWTSRGLTLPERGTPIEADRFRHLEVLNLPVEREADDPESEPESRGTPTLH